MQRYEVCVKVYGYVTVGVEGDSFEQAKELAYDELDEFDFGELYNVEYEAVIAERDDGKYMEC